MDYHLLLLVNLQPLDCPVIIKITLWQNSFCEQKNRSKCKIPSVFPVNPSFVANMLRWEKLKNEGLSYGHIYRAKVPGGWLVAIQLMLGASGGEGITFYPGPNHKWDGSSLD